MPMNVKEFDNFFSAISWPFFVQISSKIVNFIFLSRMLNFAISFVFRQKLISCVPTDVAMALRQIRSSLSDHKLYICEK